MDTTDPTPGEALHAVTVEEALRRLPSRLYVGLWRRYLGVKGSITVDNVVFSLPQLPVEALVAGLQFGRPVSYGGLLGPEGLRKRWSWYDNIDRALTATCRIQDTWLTGGMGVQAVALWRGLAGGAAELGHHDQAGILLAECKAITESLEHD